MTESVATTLTERQRYWLEQVQACEASGKTVAEYTLDLCPAKNHAAFATKQYS